MAITAAAAKKRAKARAILASQKTNEPIIDKDNVRMTLSMALNYYSANTSSKDQKAFALSYFKKQNKELAASLNKLPDWRFVTFGSICRLLDRGVYELEWYEESSFFKNKLAELTEAASKIKEVEEEVKQEKVIVSIQDRIREKARELAGEVEGEIDNFTTGGYKSTFDMTTFLKSNEVTGPVAKIIGEFYVPQVQEMKEALAGTCEQLNEGYSHMSKVEKKRFIAFLESIVSACTQQIQVAKVSRAPRKRKPVSPIKVVARVKFMKEFEELKLKSIAPVNMLESTEIWVYNTKYRRLAAYKAINGSTLGIKGTTIIGFDTSESKSMTLRKPEEFFKGLSVGKRALNSALKNIKTKAATPNGRINDDCIILGAF